MRQSQVSQLKGEPQPEYPLVYWVQRGLQPRRKLPPRFGRCISPLEDSGHYVFTRT